MWSVNQSSVIDTSITIILATLDTCQNRTMYVSSLFCSANFFSCCGQCLLMACKKLVEMSPLLKSVFFLLKVSCSYLSFSYLKLACIPAFFSKHGECFSYMQTITYFLIYLNTFYSLYNPFLCYLNFISFLEIHCFYILTVPK